MKKYKRITYKDRVKIELLLGQFAKPSEIGEAVRQASVVLVSNLTL
jgi:hypothetical protein